MVARNILIKKIKLKARSRAKTKQMYAFSFVVSKSYTHSLSQSIPPQALRLDVDKVHFTLTVNTQDTPSRFNIIQVVLDLFSWEVSQNKSNQSRDKISCSPPYRHYSREATGRIFKNKMVLWGERADSLTLSCVLRTSYHIIIAPFFQVSDPDWRFKPPGSSAPSKRKVATFSGGIARAWWVMGFFTIFCTFELYMNLLRQQTVRLL